MEDRKYRRITLAERRSIEKGLDEGKSIGNIAAGLGRAKSTISREIVRNPQYRKTGGYGYVFNDCARRGDCLEYRLCDKEGCRRQCCRGCKLCRHVCLKYEKENCERLSLPPYVCNGCAKRRSCTLEKAVYKASHADYAAADLLKRARSGVDMTEAERARLDTLISPLIKAGHSPYHICLNNKDALMVSEKTVYNYIALGLLSAKSTDLLRKVRMRPRKSRPQVKIERDCRKGRTYDDFLAYIEKNPDTPVAQMDTVIGAKGRDEKVLLTIHLTAFNFMLAFIRDANTARSVKEIFDKLNRLIGTETFSKLFPVILTDNGSEFSNPSALEADRDGVIRALVFYCDPGCSFQKPQVENNHTLIRRILKKGSSFNDLTQDDVNLMMNHINSLKRKALGGFSPTELFVKAFGKRLLGRLGLRIIPPNDVTLNDKLFK